MTHKKTMAIYVDKELEERVYELRKYGKFRKCSKSQIIRMLIETALNDIDNDDEMA